MATKRLLMRKLREILRLKYEARLRHRAIARACGIGAGTVSVYLARARAAGLSWPLVEGLDDGQLERKVFGGPLPSKLPRPLLDLPKVHQELKRPGVTLQLLWLEYLEHNPEGYRYSQFCQLYRRWRKRLHPTMRQRHRAGEEVFVDYSGKKLHLVDAQTGELRPVELFVGVLGASGLIYAEASADQSLPSWVDCHLHMLEYFGGAPEVFVPDQLKSAVAAPCRYEPEVNRTYQTLARHYGAVVIPARARKPKDKAKAEAAVLMAQRWILAVVRDQPFFTLAEINAAIRKQLDRINHRPMKPVGKSRFELFAALDRPALKPLPAERFEMAQWKLCRVSLDYPVEVERNYYSVPCVLLHEPLEARFTASVVELYYRGRRVASHPRLPGPGQYSTCSEHMPRAHREHAEWSPSPLIAWAALQPVCRTELRRAGGDPHRYRVDGTREPQTHPTPQGR